MAQAGGERRGRGRWERSARPPSTQDRSLRAEEPQKVPDQGASARQGRVHEDRSAAHHHQECPTSTTSSASRVPKPNMQSSTHAL